MILYNNILQKNFKPSYVHPVETKLWTGDKSLTYYLCFPSTAELGKDVTVLVPIIPSNVTNNNLVIFMIIISRIKVFIRPAIFKQLMIRTVTVKGNNNIKSNQKQKQPETDELLHNKTYEVSFH